MTYVLMDPRLPDLGTCLRPVVKKTLKTLRFSGISKTYLYTAPKNLPVNIATWYVTYVTDSNNIATIYTSTENWEVPGVHDVRVGFRV